MLGCDEAILWFAVSSFQDAGVVRGFTHLSAKWSSTLPYQDIELVGGVIPIVDDRYSHVIHEPSCDDRDES